MTKIEFLSKIYSQFLNLGKSTAKLKNNYILVYFFSQYFYFEDPI